MNADPDLPTGTVAHAMPEALSVMQQRIGLVDGPEPLELTALVTLLAECTGVPVSLVSIVQRDNDRQFFAAAHGLPRPWSDWRQTPLSHSFCKHVASSGTPLVVNNALKTPLVRDNLAVNALGAVAYLGVPIHWTDGTPIGAVCVIDGQERQWSDADLQRLKSFAACVDGYIRTLQALHERELALAEADFARLSQRLFYSELNHELRTPLNGIIGIAEMLANGAHSDDDAIYIGVLKESAETLLRVVETAISGEAPQEPGGARGIAMFDVLAMLDEIVSVLMLHGDGVTIRIRADPDLVALRRGERLRVRHVFYDVLRVAVASADGGHVLVGLEDAGDKIVCSVSVFRRPAGSSRAPQPHPGDLGMAKRLQSVVGGCLHWSTRDGNLAVSIEIPLSRAAH